MKTNISQKYGKHLKSSIPDIIKELNLNASKPTVCRTLKCINFSYQKLACRMRRKRVDIARAFIKDRITNFLMPSSILTISIKFIH